MCAARVWGWEGQELAAEGTPPATSESGSWGCLAEPPSPTGIREQALQGRRRAESLLAPPVASVAGDVGHHSRTAPFQNKQHTSTGKLRQRNSRKHEVLADAPALRGGRSVEPHSGAVHAAHHAWGSAGDHRPVGTSAPFSCPAAFPDSAIRQADSTLHSRSHQTAPVRLPGRRRPQPEFPRPRHQQSWLSLRPSVSPSIGLLQALGFQWI